MAVLIKSNQNFEFEFEFKAKNQIELISISMQPGHLLQRLLPWVMHLSREKGKMKFVRPCTFQMGQDTAQSW